MSVFKAAILFFINLGYMRAQISPPGLDNTRVVTWAAVGFKQQIAKRWNMVFYAGGSRESDPNNLSTLKKQGIAVLNQETYYSISQHWQVAACTSFRIQNFYEEHEPFEASSIPFRNEIRHYARLFYRHKIARFSLAYSFRPEYRMYYTPNWETWQGTPVELRIRYKAQASTHINVSKTNFIVLTNEVLTATDHRIVNNHKFWSAYQFTEDRATTYFRHIFKSSIAVDIGIMHQFLRTSGGKIDYIAYLAFDLIFQNPFSKKSSIHN